LATAVTGDLILKISIDCWKVDERNISVAWHLPALVQRDIAISAICGHNPPSKLIALPNPFPSIETL
jgi:hypothetical protein